MNRQNRVFFTLLYIFLSPFITKAQFVNDSVPITLESPNNTILVHLHYLQAETYDPAASASVFQDIVDSTYASKMAIQLKQIYDGDGLYVDINRAPTDSNYVDSLSKRSIYVPFPEKLPQIFLERVNERWYYSQRSIDAIPVLHKKVYPFGTDRLINLFPKTGQDRFLGLMLWQWLGLIILLGIAFLFYFLLSLVLNPIVQQITSSKLYPSLIPKRLVRRLARLISVLLLIRLLRILIPILQLPIEVNTLVLNLLKMVGIIVFMLIALRIVDVAMKYVDKATKRTSSKMDEQLVPILTRTLQSIIIVVAIIYVLRLFNVNVTALIAGISIGGLALALAAQDTLKHLFGSMMIFFDKPFQIGDAISFNGVDGTVEEVGFRSTRIRTFSNSLVYVPNGKLSDSVIDNIGLRAFRRFKTNITITYDTPPHLIELFVEGLREIVAGHPATRKDAFEVHLNGMSANSLDILFYIFFDVASWKEELSARHEIILATLKLAERIGVSFAFPTSTIHIEDFPHQGATKTSTKKSEEEGRQAMDTFLEEYRKGLKKE